MISWKDISCPRVALSQATYGQYLWHSIALPSILIYLYVVGTLLMTRIAIRNPIPSCPSAISEKILNLTLKFSVTGEGTKLLDLFLLPTTAYFISSRVCPGKFIAESSLWMAVMSILAVFNIEHEIGPNGDRIPPKAEYCSGVLRFVFAELLSLLLIITIYFSEPLPFKCTIKPRSSTHDALIREAQLDL